MIILFTKKLREFLEIPAPGAPLPEHTNEDAYWHGNIFLIDRKKVLQLTHEASRFTLFIHGITKKDLKNFDKLVLKHLRYHMLQEQVPLKEMNYADSLSNEAFSYFKKTDRSVLGTMKNMKLIYENAYYSMADFEDKKITHKINHMLFKIDSEYIYPIEVFKEYLLESTIILDVNSQLLPVNNSFS